jgi:hypothetical protein
MSRLRYALSVPLAALALVVAAPVAYAQAQTEGEKLTRIPLTHVKPSAVVAYLRDTTGENPGLLPEGITTLSPDEVNQGLLVKGSEGAVARMKEIAALLDVPATTVRLQVRLLKPTSSEVHPTAEPEILAVASVQTTNNTTAPLSLLAGGMFVDLVLTPRVNGNGTIQVSGKASFTQTARDRNKERKRVSAGAATKVYQAGSGSVLFGIVKTDILAGHQLEPGRAEYIIEITPVVVPAPRVAGK